MARKATISVGSETGKSSSTGSKSASPGLALSPVKQGSVLRPLENTAHDVTSESEIANCDDHAPSTPKRRRTTRDVTQPRINYDMKHHPMDDVMRPQAAARRRARFQQPETLGDDDEDDEGDEEPHSSAAPDFSDLDDIDERAPPAEPRSKVRGQRRSSRTKSGQKVNYSFTYHPMDEVLRPKPRARLTNDGSFSEASPRPKSKFKLTKVTEAATPNPLDLPIEPVWINLTALDQCLYRLQGGVTPRSTLLLEWEMVASGLIDKNLTNRMQLDSSGGSQSLRIRYENIHAAVETFFGSQQEPSDLHGLQQYYTEDFKIYHLEKGRKYWEHHSDSLFEPTVSEGSSEVARGASIEANFEQDEPVEMVSPEHRTTIAEDSNNNPTTYGVSILDESEFTNALTEENAGTEPSDLFDNFNHSEISGILREPYVSQDSSISPPPADAHRTPVSSEESADDARMRALLTADLWKDELKDADHTERAPSSTLEPPRKAPLSQRLSAINQIHPNLLSASPTSEQRIETSFGTGRIMDSQSCGSASPPQDQRQSSVDPPWWKLSRQTSSREASPPAGGQGELEHLNGPGAGYHQVGDRQLDPASSPKEMMMGERKSSGNRPRNSTKSFLIHEDSSYNPELAPANSAYARPLRPPEDDPKENANHPEHEDSIDSLPPDLDLSESLEDAFSATGTSIFGGPYGRFGDVMR